MTSHTYPTRTVTQTFDLAGRLSSVGGYATEMLYAAHGALEQQTLGNGLRESADFTSQLQPQNIALSTPDFSDIKLWFSYGYGSTNNNGNIRTHSSVFGAPFTQRYEYDALNRLEVAVEDPLTPPPAGQPYVCPDPSGSDWCEKYAYL